jgi:hypothetical protein
MNWFTFCCSSLPRPSPQFLTTLLSAVAVNIEPANQGIVLLGPSHSSGDQSAASHRGGDSGSLPRQVMCDLCWTKWHWGRFTPSTSASPADPYSSICFTFINHRIINSRYSLIFRVTVTWRLEVYRQSVRLGVNPLRLTIRDFLQLTPSGHSPLWREDGCVSCEYASPFV